MIYDEIIHFENHKDIKLCFSKGVKFTNCKTYNTALAMQENLWHQIIISHRANVRHSSQRQEEILDAIFKVVDCEEFFPISYKCGSSNDSFLVRKCKPALDKLFDHNLQIYIKNGVSYNLSVILGIADYEFGQISAQSQIPEAVIRLLGELNFASDGVVNLSEFRKNKEFNKVYINLGNSGVLDCICKTVFKSNNFRHVNGINLANNGISVLTPLDIFKDTLLTRLDLRNNKISSATRLCADLKNIKADEILLGGNKITTLNTYPTCLKDILSNFKLIDGRNIEKLTSDYTPMQYEVDSTVDGYRIDWTNKSDVKKFSDSDHWHVVVVPDSEKQYSKDEIFEGFFATLDQKKTEVYPCYYKFENAEHKFMVRNCFDQIEYLVHKCNMEIKFVHKEAPSSSNDFVATEHVISINYYFRMNVSQFVKGQLEPEIAIEKALEARYNGIKRILNLANFQDSTDFASVVINMSQLKVLKTILSKASRKFVGRCIEINLSQNKIINANCHKALAFIGTLRAIDLGFNSIEEINDFNDLKKLGLKSLVLDGNPFCSKFTEAKEYRSLMLKYFPELETLDGVKLSKRSTLSTLKNSLTDLDAYHIVNTFVPVFFQKYDSSNRVELGGLYHPKSLFSLTFDFKVTVPSVDALKRLTVYEEYSRNILKMKSFDRSYNSLHYGPDDIMRAFMSLPKTTHDMLTFHTDTTQFYGYTIITINGVFSDKSDLLTSSVINMAFSRVFTLICVDRCAGFLKGAEKYMILNDQLHICNPTKQQTQVAFKYEKIDVQEDETITEVEKVCCLEMFKEVTKLKNVWASRFLNQANWSFKKALELFMNSMDKEELPDAAFKLELESA
ncbi:nuclear RNA export factor 2 [Teleopsis dalmanni]|uniref:nuclear RNA export factor 2 n=1 Tax=Teleopsis dalmanni TaxID=139649 RepID=UPI0018CF94E5|nr:nuclear RNA export factor 2 [Teleopsis dalmanni]